VSGAVVGDSVDVGGGVGEGVAVGVGEGVGEGDAVGASVGAGVRVGAVCPNNEPRRISAATARLAIINTSAEINALDERRPCGPDWFSVTAESSLSPDFRARAAAFRNPRQAAHCCPG
jgi:hypothetical protein